MNTILFVGHEASATGAPFTQLYLIRWLKQHTTHRVVLILITGGALEKEFEEIADEVHVVHGKSVPTIKGRVIDKLDRSTDFRRKLLERRIKQLKPTIIFANTALTIDRAARFKAITGAKLVINIHELDSTFYYFAPHRFEANVGAVDMFIMGSYMVKKYYQDWCSIDDKRAVVIYDFISDKLSGNSTSEEIRADLAIPVTSKVIGSIAVLYPRKGADIFIRVAQQVIKEEPTTYFVWVGGRRDSPEYKALQRDVDLLQLNKQILFVGEQRDLRGYYDLLDVFMLPSREDPFPLVCLEAALAGRPVICFDKAGGMPEFVRDDAGAVIPYLDDEKMAAKIVELLKNPNQLNQLGQTAQQRVLAQHTISTIGPAMYEIMERFMPTKV